MGHHITDLHVGYIIKDKQDAKNTYKIIQRLGKGGNGVAYLVQCIRGELIGNFFTLKILNKMDENGKSRFLDEIKFISENKHPSILKHYDEGIFEESPFVITEYLRHTLKDVLHSVELRDALIYSIQLLSAVNYLQKNNCVHRDIKPQNIFLDNSNAVLGDFGLIKNLDVYDKEDNVEYLRNAMPNEYRTPQLVHYLETGELNKKTDIFQLGLVLYELFTKENILKQASRKNSPIVQKSFKDKQRIKSDKYGARIQGLIDKMITLDENEMFTTIQLLEGFQGVLADYFVEIGSIEFKITL